MWCLCVCVCVCLNVAFLLFFYLQETLAFQLKSIFLRIELLQDSFGFEAVTFGLGKAQRLFWGSRDCELRLIVDNTLI